VPASAACLWLAAHCCACDHKSKPHTSAGADALARGARALEDASPSEASALYAEALELYESDGKEAQATDAYRAAVAQLLRQGAWADAASTLLRLGMAADRAGARASQSKAYLGVVVVWLTAGDAAAAWHALQDVLGVEQFASSDEAFAAHALLAAVASGDVAAVRNVVASRQCFKMLDAPVARLALKLPCGDAAAQAAALGPLTGGGAAAAGGDDEELL
jgi:gamma-soluble NSF attachment protein